MCSVLPSDKGQYTIDKKNRRIEKGKNLKNKLYKDCVFKFINKKIFQGIKLKKYNKLEDFIYDDYLSFNKISYFIINELPLRIDTTFDIKRTKRKIKNV